MTDLVPAEPYDRGIPVELEAVPLAVVRHEGVRLDELRDLFDTAYPAIGALLGTGALVPAGPALAVYHGNVQEPSTSTSAVTSSDNSSVFSFAGPD